MKKVRMIMQKKSEGTPMTDTEIKATITKFCDDMQTMLDTKFKSVSIDISKELKEFSESLSELRGKAQ